MLVLASGSPRRRELLALITPDFDTLPLDLDERAITAGTPAALVEKLAAAKAEAAAALRPGCSAHHAMRRERSSSVRRLRRRLAPAARDFLV